MAWVRDSSSFHNFIGYVILTAPTFPQESILSDDDQLDIDKAFDEIRKGMVMFQASVTDSRKRQKMVTLLDESLAAYRAGDKATGAQLLGDFEGMFLSF